MTTRTRAAARIAVLCAASVTGTTACEDPIIVIGDLPGIMRRVAGVPNSAGATVDSLAIRTLLRAPRGLAVANDGTLYIADSGNGRVIALSPAGRTSVLGGPQSCTEACLVEPHGLALDGSGSLWIADPVAHRIFRLDLVTGVLEVRAGTGIPGNSPALTPALQADLNQPTGVAISASGRVYFSERGNHRIRWIEPQAGIRNLAGTGEAGYSEGSPATNARINGPAGVFISGSTLYFADQQNNRVRTVALVGGSIRTIAGNGVAGYSETDSIAVTAKLNRPSAITVTPDGTQLYIADEANDVVRVVNLATGRIARFAGTGEPFFLDEGLDAADTPMDMPAGVAVHPDGILFVSVAGHQIVWRTPLRF